MAKARFNREDIIKKTIELFWKHGYSGSSMQQVVEATGLKPGSIYLAFGSKEGLFREALESYSAQGLALMGTILDSSNSVNEGICTILKRQIDDSTQKDYCSCFLLKTQLELGSDSSNLSELAGSMLKKVELLFQDYLEREYDKGTSRRRAIAIMLHIFGLRVYGYQKDSSDNMLLGLKEGLPWLPWDQSVEIV